MPRKLSEIERKGRKAILKALANGKKKTFWEAIEEIQIEYLDPITDRFIHVPYSTGKFSQHYNRKGTKYTFHLELKFDKDADLKNDSPK